MSLYDQGCAALVAGDAPTLQEAFVQSILLKGALLTLAGAGALGMYVARKQGTVTGVLAGLTTAGVGIGVLNLTLNAMQNAKPKGTTTP